MHSGFENCFTEHTTTEIFLMFVKHSIKVPVIEKLAQNSHMMHSELCENSTERQEFNTGTGITKQIYLVDCTFTQQFHREVEMFTFYL
jgi:hypothetical protein